MKALLFASLEEIEPIVEPLDQDLPPPENTLDDVQDEIAIEEELADINGMVDGIGAATDSVNELTQVGTVLTENPEIGIESLKISILSINSIAGRLGITHRPIVASESTLASGRNYALESTADFVRRILQSIKRILVMIGERIVSVSKRFYEYLWRRKREQHIKEQGIVRDNIVVLRVDIKGWDANLSPIANIQRDIKVSQVFFDIVREYETQITRVVEKIERAVEASKNDAGLAGRILKQIYVEWERATNHGLLAGEKLLLSQHIPGFQLVPTTRSPASLSDFTLEVDDKQIVKIGTCKSESEFLAFTDADNNWKDETIAINKKISDIGYRMTKISDDLVKTGVDNFHGVISWTEFDNSNAVRLVNFYQAALGRVVAMNTAFCMAADRSISNYRRNSALAVYKR